MSNCDIGINENMNKKKIIFCGISVAVSILITFVFSNIDWIQGKTGKIKNFSYGPVQPYSLEEDTYRFAVNDIDEQLEYMVLSIPSVSDFDSIDIYYQKFEDDQYHSISLDFENSDGIISQYSFKNKGVVKNLYVDLKGEIDQIPTIFIKNKEAIIKVDLKACILGIVFLVLMWTFYYFRRFFIDIYNNKEIVKMLVINDIRSRYAGSFLGIIWSFAQPILTILVFWFVFQLGFKNPPVKNIPYILWFIPAYIPWVYFQDVVINATGCLREYSYLVKKMKFKISILPIIKVISSFLIHWCFVIFMFFAYAIYREKISLMTLQIIYYSCAMAFMVCGLAWLISALSVFMKDFAQIIGIILQLGYFAIPIFWTEDMMAPVVLMVLKLNPIYYIVQGYRDCMSGSAFFWDYPIMTIYFWLFSIAVFWGGIILFEKSQKHFADLI